jgi:hypothetical protein
LIASISIDFTREHSTGAARLWAEICARRRRSHRSTCRLFDFICLFLLKVPPALLFALPDSMLDMKNPPQWADQIQRGQDQGAPYFLLR